MPQLKIDTKALLDLGTSDIIQGEVQYKKKNTLNYLGLLSNMTKRAGDGFLSTTGKNVTVDGNEITIEDNSKVTVSGISVSDTFTVTGEKILAAASLNYNDWTDNDSKRLTVAWLEARSNGAVLSIYDFTDKVYWLDHYLLTGNSVSCAAVIGTANGYVFVYKNNGNAQGVVAEYRRHHPTAEFQYRVLRNVFTNTDQDAKITLGCSSGTIGLGWDGGNPTNRKAMWWYAQNDSSGWRSYAKTMDSGASKTVQGFGCMSPDCTMVTGEPLVHEVRYWCGENFGNGDVLSRRQTNVHPNVLEYSGLPAINFANNSSIVPTTIRPYATRNFTITQVTNRVYDYETLSNGMIQVQRIHPTQNLDFYTVSGDPGTETWSWRTNNKNWLTCLQGLGNTSEDYNSRSRQAGSGDCPSSGSHTFRPRNLPTSDYQNGWNVALVHILYIYLENGDINNNLKAVTVDAETAGDLHSDGSNTTVNQIENWTKYGLINESISNQMGLLGGTQIRNTTESLNGTQLFPHLRWFYNDKENRGTTYDYGPGWMKCLYTNFYVRNMSSYGYAIFETPLQLISANSQSFPGNSQHYNNYNLDMLARSNQDVACLSNVSLHADYTFTGMNDSYPTNSKGEFVDEKEFLSCYEYSVGNKMRLMRLHPIRSAQLESAVWTYNHHIAKDALSALPFNVPTVINIANRDMNFSVGYYDNNPIMISYYDTLLFTPRDLSGTYNGYYIDDWEGDQSACVWNRNGVQAVFVNNSASTKVTKLTDYIFKINNIPTNNTAPNLLVEDRNGDVTADNAFFSYMMQGYFNMTNYYHWFKMPEDAEGMNSNDVWYQAAGINANMDDNYVSSSFLLPAITLPLFVNTADQVAFNQIVIDSRKPLIQMVYSAVRTNNVIIDEYYTHSQLSTDITYKNSYRFVDNAFYKFYNKDKANQTWWPDGETTIYPVGIASITYGENYITSTVDTGNNYVARFYNRNNKTFLNYNNSDQVYFGSEIFTIQSGNYYFDGQGIYYLGSQTDYSQNIFTAYALGMEFLANSSAEAYFYSRWDKNLYLYTASNTLQKSVSFADCGDVVDALYSPAEQAFYILFSDKKLYIKTQADDCFVELDDEDYNRLYSGAIGAQVVSDSKFVAYNPYRYDSKEPLEIETEWLGNQDYVSVFSFVDVIFYSDIKASKNAEITVKTLNGAEVKSEVSKVEIKPNDWENQLYRYRVVPKEPIGNAIKIIVKSDEDISIFSITVNMDKKSEVPSAPRKGRG